MAVTSSVGGQSLTSSFYRQGLLEQAQRNAERAEQEARSLAASARAAQQVADRAQENARDLKVQSTQASSDAGRARQGVSALRSTAEARTELGARIERVAEVLTTSSDPVAPLASTAPAAVAPTSVVNTDGQTVGTLISVAA